MLFTDRKPYPLLLTVRVEAVASSIIVETTERAQEGLFIPAWAPRRAHLVPDSFSEVLTKKGDSLNHVFF